jgi:rod shape-determining protein MreD
MARILTIGFVIYINFILQTTWLRHIAILGVVPLTAMLIIVSYAILRGDVEGAVVGFCAGLLQDVFFMDVIGIHALLFAVTGYICGKPFKDFFTDSFLLPVVLTLFAMLGYETIFYFINFTMRGRLADYFRIIILPETIYTMLLAIPVYRLMFYINKKIEGHEKKYRNIF